MAATGHQHIMYRVIQNDCRGFNNLSYTIYLVLQMQPHVISFYGVTSRIRLMFLLFSQVSRNWRSLHATNSLERTRLSCWCLQNHKGCTYGAPIRYVTKTCSVVLLNKKKYVYSYLKYIVYDKLLKPDNHFESPCTWCADDPLRPSMNLRFFYRRSVYRETSLTQEVQDHIPK